MLEIHVGCAPDDQPATDSNDAPSVDAADTVYTNGRIYTVNEAEPWTEALAVRDGKIIVVGSNADVEAVTGDNTKTVDLGGRMAMPGLIDSHSHPMAVSVDKANLNLVNRDSEEALLAEIEAYANANPDVPYIRGGNWNLGVFSNNSPRKELLDAIVPDRPVYLYSQTGHEAWVNTKTLELIGLADREQDNQYSWDVDPETGEPSGTIREYSMSLVERALGGADPEVLAPALEETVQLFTEAGFTSIKEAGAEVWTTRAANLLDEQGRLNIRFFPAWFHMAHNGAMTPEESKAVAARWQEFVTPMVYPRYAKMYADGASNSYSALLLEDYADRPGFKGAMHFPYQCLENSNTIHHLDQLSPKWMMRSTDYTETG